MLSFIEIPCIFVILATQILETWHNGTNTDHAARDRSSANFSLSFGCSLKLLARAASAYTWWMQFSQVSHASKTYPAVSFVQLLGNDSLRMSMTWLKYFSRSAVGSRSITAVCTKRWTDRRSVSGDRSMSAALRRISFAFMKLLNVRTCQARRTRTLTPFRRQWMRAGVHPHLRRSFQWLKLKFVRVSGPDLGRRAVAVALQHLRSGY